METMNLEMLLNKPYRIVDILPERVPAGPRGQYFAVERYFLEEPRRTEIRRKHAGVLLKLNCYYDMQISADAGESWEKDPKPEDLVRVVADGDPAGSVFALIKEEDTLIVLNGDDTYMTVYGPPEELLEKIRRLAAAEGLFVW